MLKEILIFTGGFAAGAGAAYFALKKKLEAEKKKELEEMSRFYSKRAEKRNEKKDENTLSDKLPPDKEVKAAYGEAIKSYVSSFEKADKTLYDDAMKAMEKPSDNQNEEEEETEELDDYAPIEKRDEPYSINRFSFEHDCDFYDKVYLSYYEVDGVVIEDEEEVIAPFDILGSSFIQSFGEFEPDYAFIRNDKIATDYEVELIHAAYYDQKSKWS